MIDKAKYQKPEMTTLGKVAEITAGDKSGFSDDGGHAGYKEEGGTMDAAPYEKLPPLKP